MTILSKKLVASSLFSKQYARVPREQAAISNGIIVRANQPIAWAVVRT